MESSVVPGSPSRRPRLAIAAFAAYGCWSLLAAPSSYPGGVMLGQALLYFVVAVALAKRADWAGWFAVGIATSGLAIDAVFLTAGHFYSGMAVDTAAQAGLLWLALRSRARVGTVDSRHRLTSTAAPAIGWTFALAAGVLPPAVMGALMPTWRGCLSPFLPWDGSGALMALVLLMPAALYLVARLRTIGLLVLLASLTTAGFIATQAALGTWSWYATLGSITHNASLPVPPDAGMAFVAFGFALAALVPLGPRLLRALASQRR